MKIDPARAHMYSARATVVCYYTGEVLLPISAAVVTQFTC